MTLCIRPSSIALSDPVKLPSPAVFRHDFSISLAPTKQHSIMHPGAGHGANQSPWMPSPPPQPPNAAIDTYHGFHSMVNDSIHSVDVPVQNPNFQDHEMFSWLHFPVDEGYGSDWMGGDLPTSSVQIVKHSLNQLGLQQEIAPFNASGSILNVMLESNSGYPGVSGSAPPLGQTAGEAGEAVQSCSSGLEKARTGVAGADAVMALDEGQAVAFSAANPCIEDFRAGGSSRMQVDMSVGPLPVDKHLQQAEFPVSKLKISDTTPIILAMDSSQLQNPYTYPYNGHSPHRVLLKPLDASFSGQPSSMPRNFAHFSSPVAETKANLHVVGAGSGPTSIERARQHNSQLEKAELNGISKKDPQLLQNDTVQGRCDPLLLQGLPLPTPAPLPLPPPLLLPPPQPALTAQESETGRGKSVMDETFINSNASNSAVTGSDRNMDKQPAAEQTVTSPSRASRSSSDKSGKETAVMMSKRKGSGMDDSECQSEDFEEATNSSKKPVKRSRAAEMHNLCERKRRDRINEKLMALRELMPNSSKTAKASILDEAIEYVKLLQSQLQAWSTRTGICVPPSLMPNMGMQQMQMPTFPHVGLGMGVGMGVGLGMGMGMGMGLMDVNTAAVMSGRTIVPILPMPPQPSGGGPSSGPQSCVPSTGMVESQAHLQNTQILEPFNLYTPHQVQVQSPSVNANLHRNMELYHAYMQGQQQQQQQQQQLQQQQQQQHWHQLQPHYFQ